MPKCSAHGSYTGSECPKCAKNREAKETKIKATLDKGK